LLNVKGVAMTTLEVEASVSSKVQITLPAALRAVLSASKEAQKHGLAIKGVRHCPSVRCQFLGTEWQ
jgi:hypothetical protein